MEEWPKEGLELSRGGGTVRGTQSFVRVMQWCWRHPGVVGLEVLWRWIFGSFALSLLWVQGSRIFAAVTGGTNDVSRLGMTGVSIADPMGSSVAVAAALGLLLPPIFAVAMWMVPLLLVVWLVVSSIGRTVVLRRVDARLRAVPVVLGTLQLVRVLALGASFALWWMLVRWAARISVTEPLARGDQPLLVEYFAVAIVGTLVLFCGWGILSWGLSLAPLIAMRRGSGVVASLRASMARGPLRLKLVEINLVMGIVKIALIVLLMVFSACPLPFQSVETTAFLVWWTLGVAVLYLLGSDFFHVARMVAYLELWRAYNEPAVDADGDRGAEVDSLER